jgi:Lar family restriction alleviation protein
MPMSEPSLKPCPFCGGKASFNRVPVNNRGQRLHFASCDECEFDALHGADDAEGAAKWNRRAGPPAPAVSRLLAAAKDLVAAEVRSSDTRDDCYFYSALDVLEKAIADTEAEPKIPCKYCKGIGMTEDFWCRMCEGSGIEAERACQNNP